MSIIKKIITKSKSHQKNLNNNLTYTSLEKIWDLHLIRLVNRSTKKCKKVQEVQVSFFENN